MNPEDESQSDEAIHSVVLATRSGTVEVLDSEALRDATGSETCATVHELDLDELTYFGLAARDATMDDGVAGKDAPQSAAMGFVFIANLMLGWSRMRRS